MPSDDQLLISTVVIAHRRPEFLVEALRSVIGQAAGPYSQETVLVKNFDDREVDELCRAEGIRNLLTSEESATGKIALGLEACRGEVVTFLDYDDTFAPGRLAAVAAEFRTHPRLGFFRNGLRFVDERLHTVPSEELAFSLRLVDRQSRRRVVADAAKARTDPRLGGIRPDFNIGSMAARREVVAGCVPYLGRVRLTFDSLLFYAAWASAFDLAFDPRKLTNYRLHRGNTSVVGAPGGGPVQERVDFAQWRADDHRLIQEYVASIGRPELQRDLEVRACREALVALLDAGKVSRRAILAKAPELRARGPGSRLVRLQLTGYLLAALTSPALARRLVRLSR